MSESTIGVMIGGFFGLIGVVVGGLFGVIGTVIGTVISHRLRERQVKDIWAEEERRRRSDRKREIYQRELKVVNDSVDAVIKAMVEVRSVLPWRQVDAKSRGEAFLAAGKVVDKAEVVAASLGESVLAEQHEKLMDVFTDWMNVLDWETGLALKGKEEELKELRTEVRDSAALLLGRIREILEEA